jgi:elongation factor Tu
MAVRLTMKSSVNVGTLGEAGHGKTTLAAAITRVQAWKSLARYVSYAQIARGETLQDETKAVPITAGRVEYESPKRHYRHVDCSEHADHIKNLITGTAPMDGAILVVSAPDSVMRQTRDHVLLARQAGLNHIVVFLNKCDTVDDPERLDLVEMEVRELLSKFKFDGDNAPIIRGAALQALECETPWDGNAPTDAEIAAANPNIEGPVLLRKKWQGKIVELLNALDSHIPAPGSDADKPFLMAIEDAASVQGSGTVTTGPILRGVVKVDDSVEIIGFRETQKTVVTAVEMFRSQVESARAGDRVGCRLRGVERTEVERGQVLARPGSIAPHSRFMSEVYVLKKEEGGRHTSFFTNYRPQFYIRTADVTGTVSLLEDVKEVRPGDSAPMNIELIAGLALEEGTRFTIREGGRTVGAGIVTKILP